MYSFFYNVNCRYYPFKFKMIVYISIFSGIFISPLWRTGGGILFSVQNKYFCHLLILCAAWAIGSIPCLPISHLYNNHFLFTDLIYSLNNDEINWRLIMGKPGYISVSILVLSYLVCPEWILSSVDKTIPLFLIFLINFKKTWNSCVFIENLYKFFSKEICGVQ